MKFKTLVAVALTVAISTPVMAQQTPVSYDYTMENARESYSRCRSYSVLLRDQLIRLNNSISNRDRAAFVAGALGVVVLASKISSIKNLLSGLASRLPERVAGVAPLAAQGASAAIGAAQGSMAIASHYGLPTLLAAYEDSQTNLAEYCRPRLSAHYARLERLETTLTTGDLLNDLAQLKGEIGTLISQVNQAIIVDNNPDIRILKSLRVKNNPKEDRP